MVHLYYVLEQQQVEIHLSMKAIIVIGAVQLALILIIITSVADWDQRMHTDINPIYQPTPTQATIR
jgi:hypothetical protein